MFQVEQGILLKEAKRKTAEEEILQWGAVSEAQFNKKTTTKKTKKASVKQSLYNQMAANLNEEDCDGIPTEV